VQIDRVPFTNLLARIVDNRGRTCPTVDHGMPLIATNCIANDRLFPMHEKVRYVSEETYGTWFRGHPEPGDLIFVCKGSPGNVAMAPDPVGFCIAQDMVAVRADPQVVYPRFLFAALRSPLVQTQIENLHVGTLIPHFKKGDFDKLLIPLPDRRTQGFIGDMYFDLSVKIEANHRIVELSDALWQAAASEVLDRIESGDDATPEGDMRALSSLASFVNGRAFTKGATGTGKMVVRIAELNSGPGSSTVYNHLDVADDYLARPGDLLFAWSGSLTVQRWFRPEAIVNQHIFKVVPAPGVPVWLVHAHLMRLLPGYQRIAAGKATTMGHIQRHDLDTSVGVPSQEALVLLDSLCSSLCSRSFVAEVESLALAQLRDAILPKLLSGEIRVRDAEALVEEAV
jgi:type I restriction enzyme, S subunit